MAFISQVPNLGNIYDGTGRWSELDETGELIQQLGQLSHKQEILEKQGYRFTPLSEEEKLNKLRCEVCAQPMSIPESSAHAVALPTDHSKDGQKLKRKKVGKCSFHKRKPSRGLYPCCGTRIFTKGDRGCTQSKTHTAPPNFEAFLEIHWRYHFTPTVAPASSSPLKVAVALDCEFGVNKYAEPELVRISLVDILSGETLIDQLVYPHIPMKHYNTRFSGIRANEMEVARARRTCLMGRDAAREAVLQHIGPDTLVVVHGGSGDLTSLRLLHHRVLDTNILDKRMGEIEGGRSLKNLCDKRLDIQVQKGRHGHDSVEDALATRELLLHYLKHPLAMAKADTNEDPATVKDAIAQQSAVSSEAVQAVQAAEDQLATMGLDDVNQASTVAGLTQEESGPSSEHTNATA